jgi:hypothetical protein
VRKPCRATIAGRQLLLEFHAWYRGLRLVRFVKSGSAVRNKTRFLAPFILALGAAACGANTHHTTLPADTRADVLSHYLHGESLERLAAEYQLAGRDDARAVVHDALLSLTRRYYKDQ